MPQEKITTGYDGLRLPYSPEGEQAVLGAILIEPECISKVQEIIRTPEYFHITTHKLIYRVMQDIVNNGKTLDFVTLIENLKKEKDYDESTGKSYLVSLADNCPSTSNVEEYAKIVADKYEVRMLIEASRNTIESATGGTYETEDLIDLAEQNIYNIRQGKSIQGLEHIQNVLYETFNRLDMLNKEGDNDLKPISTGIGDLDRVLTGLNRSDLILLAARPAMGKTAFALNIAKYVGMVTKRKVAFFSLEMTKEQLASRLLSMEARVNGNKIRSGKLNDEEWTRIISAGDVLGKGEIYLDDTPGLTVPAMKAKLRRLKDVGLVVIDYLQLMSSAQRIDNQVQKISEITRTLKILAKEINVPVICLSQLSRASEQRPDHRPMLSDLRDSGSIEQDADIVLFLYREGYYDKNGNEDVDQNSAECLVAKNRHGETCNVKLHWQGEFMRFTALEGNREE